MENIQAPWIGKPEEEWEDPDGYFDAHADDGGTGELVGKGDRK